MSHSDFTQKCSVDRTAIAKSAQWFMVCPSNVTSTYHNFHPIGNALPGQIPSESLPFEFITSCFVRVPFSFVHPLEQNSVIEPSQGSLQRFFRGGGLSPSAIKREGGESANSTNTVDVESSCNILLTTGTRFNSTHSTKLRDSQCSSVSKHVDLTVRAFYPT